jgi:hypothetical protein
MRRSARRDKTPGFGAKVYEPGPHGYGSKKARRMFFFEKKEPKNFWLLILSCSNHVSPEFKSFLVLFFKKELLSC